MKKYLFLSVILFIACICGCKMDGDVLAVYKDGRITRGEFKEWLAARNIPQEAAFGSIENQKAGLRDMAAERLILIDAKESGFDKSDDFKRVIDEFSKDAFMADFYRKELRESEKFEEEACRLYIIRLRVKEYTTENNKTRPLSDAELRKEYEEREQEAAELIARLKAGADFSELAKNNSDDYSKEKGGDIGFITRDSYERELAEAAFLLKPGEFTQKPIRHKGGVFILKTGERHILNNNNIRKIIGDEKKAKSLEEMLRASSADKHEQSLINAADVKNNIGSVNFAAGNAVIFEVGDKKVTAGYLNDLLSFLGSKFDGPSRNAVEITNDQKRDISRTLLMRTLLVRDALKNGVDKLPAYIKGWNAVYDINLFTLYLNNLFSDIKITPEQLRMEYAIQIKSIAEHNKNLQPGMRPERIRPFAEVKDRIESSLYARERSERFQKYSDNLLSASDFTVNENKLEKEKKALD
ncbi:MAG: peptidylprolyl isomerase [Leptospirales bacterium]|nr:peptidylprolyl isomerase [Leptospirales bacterium]